MSRDEVLQSRHVGRCGCLQELRQGLFHLCAVDLGNGITWVNACEQEVRALNALIGRNRTASKSASGAYYFLLAAFFNYSTRQKFIKGGE